jgi:hypothetical protein
MSFLLTRGSRGRARTEQRHLRRSVAVVLSVVTGLLVAAMVIVAAAAAAWKEAEKSLIELNLIHC